VQTLEEFSRYTFLIKTKFMSQPTQYTVYAIDRTGNWKVNDRRYFENAHVLLKELEQMATQVSAMWPKKLGESVKPAETTKEHWAMARRRDLLSDSVKIFCAMSVEAFLNFYGVLRLSDQFDKKFERLGPVRKLKDLLRICDGIDLNDTSLIVAFLKRIVDRRNAQLHPQTVEVSTMTPTSTGDSGDAIPGEARAALKDMVSFFAEFVVLIPDAANHVPPPH
jgi:hypothetical protein